GHYGCGGVRAAISRTSFGLIDNWLYSIKNLDYSNKYRMYAIESEDERLNSLCELNVKKKVKNLAHTAAGHRAWEPGQPLTIHGWIYSLQDGLAKDLGVSIQSLEELADEYRVVNGLKDG